MQKKTGFKYDSKDGLGRVYNIDLQFNDESTEKLVVTIKEHILKTLNNSPLTIRVLKRFVNENKENIEKGIVFNPYGINKEAIVYFYLMFVTGIVENQINNFKDLREFVR